jgi:hypothetical protein
MLYWRIAPSKVLMVGVSRVLPVTAMPVPSGTSVPSRSVVLNNAPSAPSTTFMAAFNAQVEADARNALVNPPLLPFRTLSIVQKVLGVVAGWSLRICSPSNWRPSLSQ